MKTDRIIFGLLGLAVGILFGAFGLQWLTAPKVSTVSSVRKAPEGPAPTIRHIRSTLRAPQFPVMLATGTVVDIKKSVWKLRSLDNSTIRFSDLAGKVLFVNSWGTGCLPCVAEMPSIQELYDSLKHDPVVFLVYSTESIDTLRSFAKREGLTMPLYRSLSGLPSAFDTKVWPSTFILNTTGTIVYAEAGGAKWSDPAVIKFIRGLYR